MIKSGHYYDKYFGQMVRKIVFSNELGNICVQWSSFDSKKINVKHHFRLNKLGNK